MTHHLLRYEPSLSWLDVAELIMRMSFGMSNSSVYLVPCCITQASAAAAAQQFPLAESLYLKAKRPEGALAMYRQAGQWQQALRLAEAYLPGKIQVSSASK
jgi:hypothetical protein